MNSSDQIKKVCHGVIIKKYSAEEFYQRLETILVEDDNIKLQNTIDSILYHLEFDIYSLSLNELENKLNDYVNQLLNCIK